jgi:hypothetical protein
MTTSFGEKIGVFLKPNITYGQYFAKPSSILIKFRQFFGRFFLNHDIHPRMGFCTDREDVNSLCLTALDRLVHKSGISYAQVSI